MENEFMKFTPSIIIFIDQDRILLSLLIGIHIPGYYNSQFFSFSHVILDVTDISFSVTLIVFQTGAVFLWYYPMASGITEEYTEYGDELS